MQIDLHLSAVNLLEKIANSVYERGKNPNLIWCFTTAEVQVVEQWLKDFMEGQ